MACQNTIINIRLKIPHILPIGVKISIRSKGKLARSFIKNMDSNLIAFMIMTERPCQPTLVLTGEDTCDGEGEPDRLMSSSAEWPCQVHQENKGPSVSMIGYSHHDAEESSPSILIPTSNSEIDTSLRCYEFPQSHTPCYTLTDHLEFPSVVEDESGEEATRQVCEEIDAFLRNYQPMAELSKCHGKKKGLSVEQMTTVSQGSLRGTRKPQSMKKQEDEREVVSSSMNSPSIQITPNDVLFGRGKFHRSHCGNEKMRELAAAFRELYEKCLDRDQKTDITRYIVDSIKHNGGRFLKYNKEDRQWYVVSDEEARQKVSHAMRDDPASTKITRRGKAATALAMMRTRPASVLSPACLKLSSDEANFLIDLFTMPRGF